MGKQPSSGQIMAIKAELLPTVAVLALACRSCFQWFDTVGWVAGRASVLYKTMGVDGGGHWLVRIEWRPAGWSVCLPLLIFPCTVNSGSSLLALAHPDGPRKRAVKWLWCGGGGRCRSEHPSGMSDVSRLRRVNAVSAAGGVSDRRATPSVPPRVGKLLTSVVVARGAGWCEQTTRHRSTLTRDCYPGVVRFPDPSQRVSEFVGCGRRGSDADDNVMARETLCPMCRAAAGSRRRWYPATVVRIAAAAGSAGGVAVADTADEGLLHDC